MSAVVAAFPGRCPAGDAIEVGDAIVSIDDVWVHEECEVDVLRARRDRAWRGRAEAARPVCSTCFMQKPCPCDDGQAPA